MRVDLSAMQTGDLLAIEGRGLYAWFIRWRTKSRFTHVATILRVDDSLQIVQATPGKGVAPMLLERYLTVTKGAIWWCPLNQEMALQHDPQYRHDLIQFMNGRFGDEYDWGGVFHYVVPWISQRKGEEYCSELAAEGLRAIGFHLDVALTPEQVIDQPCFSKRLLVQET